MYTVDEIYTSDPVCAFEYAFEKCNDIIKAASIIKTYNLRKTKYPDYFLSSQDKQIYYIDRDYVEKIDPMGYDDILGLINSYTSLQKKTENQRKRIAQIISVYSFIRQLDLLEKYKKYGQQIKPCH